jgi:hypothetical protein
LVDRHYAVNTVRQYAYGVAHFAHWARRCRVGVRDFADEIVQRFIDEHLPRCTCPSPVQRCRHQVRAALRQLLIGVLVLSMKFDTARPRKPTRDNDFSARVSAQRRADATR